MDSAKLKKLQDYSLFLTQQAESKEAQGNRNEAAKDYVKLVDVLLLLANETNDHSSWQKLIDRAEFYQKKTRTMVDPVAASREAAQPKYPVPYEINQPLKIQDQTQRQLGTESQSSSPQSTHSSSVHNPFRKFPSLMGKKPDSKSEVVSSRSFGTAPVSEPRAVVSPWTKELNTGSGNQGLALSAPNTNQLPRLPQIESNGQSPNKQNEEGVGEETVPYSIYSQLLEEKASLEGQLEVCKNKEKEYLAAMEAKEKQFAEKISEMVPRSEYEEVQAKLAESVPRSEYEQALVISAVPKEKYIELQMQLTELEIKLQNSVPKAIIDEMADYISFLASTALSSMPNEGKRASMDGETAVIAGSQSQR